MNKADRFAYLLQRYIDGDITTVEHEEFFGYLSTHEYDEYLEQCIQHDLIADEKSKHADLPPHIAQEIIRNIIAAEKNTAEILPSAKQAFPIWRWVAAASVILMIAVVYLLSTGGNKTTDHAFAAIIPPGDIIQKNNSDTQQMVLLNDGSKVFLKPLSAIHYPPAFTTEKREVYLEGEAFFQVSKNPQKPFLVFYNNIVTRVLGTSFTVNTNVETGNVEVSVRTGRVQVYENGQMLRLEQLSKSVIVTPNQKAIYRKEKRLFETTLVETPQPVGGKEQEHEVIGTIPGLRFDYVQETLTNIFKQLENVYGIEIVVENTNLNNCVFTGDVSVYDLFTKLKIICLTTNSSFEINGTKILIKGKGCN